MIATKGGIIKTGPAEIRMDGSPSNLRSSCESSLSYLKIDCIDLYQYHYVDPKIPLEDSIGALVSLKNEGKIRHIGLCNVSVDQIKKARDITLIASVQNRYNVSDRAHEDVLKYCVAEGIAFICYGPFNAEGFIQGAPLARVGSPFEPIAKRLGVAAGQVALAWLLQLGPNVIPIPGTTSPEHFDGECRRPRHRTFAERYLISTLMVRLITA